VALALSADDLATLTAQGYEVLEELAVPAVDATPRRLRIPAGTTLADARAAVRALPTGQDADFNHFYRSEGFSDDCEGLECPAGRRMIDWPEPADRASGCGGGVPIGMIDTGINDAHETFEGADLEVVRLSPEEFTPSRALHGTAIAALLVGDPATRAPGLVPSARLVAVDAFYRRGSDERADVFTLVEALGLLAERDVGVINLSLAGPPNAVLEEVVARLKGERDIVLVAAVGNDGPRAAPAFPAAYPEVIAVTAVDRERAIYRRAIRGEHVDLAAPGVAVWTAASVSGARWKTGTSYAVPFVSAAAAILREARPELTALEVGPELARLATDLGDPGPDPVFGAGLLGLGALCDDPS
jgi:subtilisin family serine protease